MRYIYLAAGTDIYQKMVSFNPKMDIRQNNYLVKHVDTVEGKYLFALTRIATLADGHPDLMEAENNR